MDVIDFLMTISGLTPNISSRFHLQAFSVMGRLSYLCQMRFFFLGLICVLRFSIFSQDTTFVRDEPANLPPDTLSVLFIGDVMQHGPQIRSAYNASTKIYEYDSCYKYLKSEMSDADITIANMEFPLGGKPYVGYPMFSAPDEAALALKRNGVDILVTANNHTCDRGKKGTIRTLDVLDSLGIGHTGSFRNMAEKELLYPMLIEKKGIRLALLNYTYGTNGIAVEVPTIVNLLKKESVLADIEKVRSMQVDKVIAFVHWGSEYQHIPNDYQKFYEKLFFDNGVDIVIGSHPHVLQPMRLETVDSTDRLVAYSLGNFVSNQRTAPRDGGAMLKLNLAKENGIVRIVNAGYQLTWVWLPTQAGRKRYYVLPASKYEMEQEMLDTWSHAKMKAFMKNSRTLMKSKNMNVPEYKFDSKNGWVLNKD